MVRNGEVQQGDVGEPMETLVFDYLLSKLGKHYQVTRWPWLFPSSAGKTNPDILVTSGEKRLYLDVSVSNLGTNIPIWGRHDPKSDQRAIFSKPKDPLTDTGIVVYQQVVMLPAGYHLLVDLSTQTMTGVLTSRAAQAQVDAFCDSYSYDIMKGGLEYWRQTADNVRAALGL